MGDSLISFVGDGFVLVAADASQARSVLLLKGNEDKIMSLDSHKLLACSGEAGDRVQFSDYIQKNIALYNFRTGTTLSTHAAAHFIRRELATALRSSPYSVNSLLGGWDKIDGASLYFLDYMAALHKLDFACQGYANYFLLGLLDKHWRRGLNLEEAVQLMDMCINELKTRFVLNTNHFVLKTVSSEGVKIIRAASASTGPA